MTRAWLVLAAAPLLLASSPRPARACTCAPITDADALTSAGAAFDGVAVAEEAIPPPAPCAIPAPRAAAPGCLALTVWDRRTCAGLAGADVQITGDSGAVEQHSGASGVVDACGLAGDYHVVVAMEGGSDPVDVTVAASGASAVVPVDTAQNWRTRFEVQTSLKGELPYQVWVSYTVVGAVCGISRFRIGDAYRVFGSAPRDGQLSTGACSGVRSLSPSDRMVAASPAPEPAPATEVVRPRSGCAGCATDGGAAPLGAVALALVVALRSRRGR